MMVRDNSVFWIFEKRDITHRNDYFVFITKSAIEHKLRKQVSESSLTMAGAYLTTGQDSSQSISHSDIIIQRAELEDPQKMKDIMHNNCEIIDGEECEYISEFHSDFLKIVAEKSK